MKTNSLKVIIIDNDLKTLETYKEYFKSYQDFVLIGVFSSINEAIQDANNLKPDIAICEVDLPHICGLTGVHYLRKQFPGVHVILNSETNSREHIRQAFEGGARGYLTKPLTRKRMVKALDSVKQDGAALSNDVVKMVISMFEQKKYQQFSERENEIIDYLGKGATYKTIAEALFVTPSAVNFHVQNIYLKLDVNSKSEALKKLSQLEAA